MQCQWCSEGIDKFSSGSLGLSSGVELHIIVRTRAPEVQALGPALEVQSPIAFRKIIIRARAPEGIDKFSGGSPGLNIEMWNSTIPYFSTL